MTKVMKKLFAAAVLIAATCGSVAAQTAPLTISAGRTEGAPGRETLVPISLKDAASVGALHVELTYDPAVLEFKSLAKGPAFAGNAMLDSNASSPGRLIIGLVSLEPLNGDGVAANVRFQARGAAGSTSPLRLEQLRAWENKNHADLLVQGEDGLFTVGAGAADATASQLGDKLPWLIAGGAVAVVLLMSVVMMKSRRSRTAA